MSSVERPSAVGPVSGTARARRHGGHLFPQASPSPQAFPEAAQFPLAGARVAATPAPTARLSAGIGRPFLGSLPGSGSFVVTRARYPGHVDTLEIIRQLRADPALADELRAVLLSQELLQLPERVGKVELQVAELRRELAEMDARLTGRLDSVDRRFDSVDQRLDSVDRRFDSVDQRLDSVDRRLDSVDRRLDSVDQRLDSVDRRLDSVDQRLHTVEDGMAGLKGDDFERTIKENPRRYLSRLLEGAVFVTPDDFDLHALDADEEHRLRQGDVIVRGRLRGSGEEVAAVVETAWVAHQDDLNKATRRAPLLARASGLPVLPVVVSRDLPAAVVIEHAQQSGIALVLAGPAEVVSPGSPLAAHSS
jgi:predicted  nucleic acid-binding Zn-ribbon protein